MIDQRIGGLLVRADPFFTASRDQQSVRVDLVINLKAAKALSITFPTSMLVRANDVIE